jgi:hypothetical protein
MTSIQQGVNLTRLELLACWTVLGLGAPPMELDLRPPGPTFDDDQREYQRAMAALAERGLSDGVRPHPQLAGMLQLLNDADLYLDIRFSDSRSAWPPVFGLGALSGANGLSLVTGDIAMTGNGEGAHRESDVVQLLPTDSSRVASTLLGLVTARGPMTPGRGAPENIPLEVFDAALAANGQGTLWDLADELQRRGVPREDGVSLARMCTDITLAGQLGATSRFLEPGQAATTGRKDKRGPWVVGFHANENGWFVQLRRDKTLTVSPTDANRLLLQWQELVENS